MYYSTLASYVQSDCLTTPFHASSMLGETLLAYHAPTHASLSQYTEPHPKRTWDQDPGRLEQEMSDC